jgi:hypothetical protein
MLCVVQTRNKLRSQATQTISLRELITPNKQQPVRQQHAAPFHNIRQALHVAVIGPSNTHPCTITVQHQEVPATTPKCCCRATISLTK